MEFIKKENYAILKGDGIILFDIDSSLDIIANVFYSANTKNLIIYEENILDDFFNLKTRLAGEILQKFTQYQTRISIVGDFSKYENKPLRDFIYESNKGRDCSFFSTLEEAINWINN